MNYELAKLPARLDEVEDWLAPAEAFRLVLFGGALRDSDNNRPVRDYDIMINLGKVAPLQEKWQQLATRVLDGLKAAAPGITHVAMGYTRHELTRPDGLMLDICFDLGQSSLMDRAEQATLGISAIAMDMDTQQVQVTKNYVKDVDNSTLTLVHGLSGFSGLDDKRKIYVRKIQAKYPDFGLVSHTPACKNIRRIRRFESEMA